MGMVLIRWFGHRRRASWLLFDTYMNNEMNTHDEIEKAKIV